MAGLLITFIGLAITFGPKIPWLGKLPGDIYIKRENASFYFPVTSCLLVSAFISLILWFLKK
ncbi:MAG: DUF2905 domain-containing protein [Desulfuromonas sp.]|nr:MAG: DUF2905 domain-containing protein [Desulfuromonas sp.]